MNSSLLSLTQAMQLAALGPCLFISLFLFSNLYHTRLTLWPALFFLALSGSFLLPILPVFEPSITVTSAALMLETMLPVLNLLVILQFFSGRIPPWPYLLLLAVPWLGGGSFIYLTALNEEVCISPDACYPARYALDFYRLFSASMVFMLLVASLAHHRSVRKELHIYWLVISLILFNLGGLGVDLARLGGYLRESKAMAIHTVFNLSFVYFFLSLIFRVLPQHFGLLGVIKTYRKATFSLNDKKIVQMLQDVMEQEKPYLEQQFSRAKLADRLKLTEQRLSHVINRYYTMSFSEWMNEKRLSHAKRLLETTSQPITVVSYDSGFSSLTSFNRVFKADTGLSPSVYRRDHGRNHAKNALAGST